MDETPLPPSTNYRVSLPSTSSSPVNVVSPSLELLLKLQSQSQQLLTELSNFQSYLREQKKEQVVEIRSFRSSVLAEARALKKFEGIEKVQATSFGSLPDGGGLQGEDVDRHSCPPLKDLKLEAGRGHRPEKGEINSNNQNVSNDDGRSFTVVSRDVQEHPQPQPQHFIDPHHYEAIGNEDSLTEVEEIEQVARTHLHALRSSNIPFLHTIWDIAKRSQALKALTKRFYLPQANGDSSKPADQNRHVTPSATTTATDRSRRTQGSVLVDIVSSDGSLWTKVSLINEKRLIFDMAKEGYGIDDFDEDEEESERGSSEESEDIQQTPSQPDIELVRLASDLQTASKTAPRVNYLHPRVRLVLPRLSETANLLPQIKSILAGIRAMGIEVMCKDDIEERMTLPVPQTYPPREAHSNSSTTTYSLSHLAPSDAILPSLPNNPNTLTPTLNLDCTILLALVSDISHLLSSHLSSPPPSGTNSFHAAIRAQIASEAIATKSLSTPQSPQRKPSQRLLEAHLYPLLRNRSLQTTVAAAKRMAEIVLIIGTHTERSRVTGLFGVDVQTLLDRLSSSPSPLVSPQSQPANEEQIVKSNAECHDLLSSPELTDFPIPPPEDLHLPITIISDITPESQAQMSRFRPYVREVSQGLSEINTSVFLTGWMRGMCTVTSNRGVARQILEAVCKGLDDLDVRAGGIGAVEQRGIVLDIERGPRIWVVGVCRSLIGKEKKNKKDPGEGDIP